MPTSCDTTKKNLEKVHDEIDATDKALEQEQSRLFNWTIAPIVKYLEKIMGEKNESDDSKKSTKGNKNSNSRKQSSKTRKSKAETTN